MTPPLPETYLQAAFKSQGANLTLEHVPLKQPTKGEILVKVEACGVCHSEVFAQQNTFGAGFPMVPGHEIIGKVVAVGSDVAEWKVGDRIGSGYHGGFDGTCAQCKSGWTQMCNNASYNGITRNGGFAEYVNIRAEAAVRVPDEADAAKLAPLLCAGSTVFSALKSANITTGQTVAVQGLGGLGHLAIQFARRMGYRVIAISRGPEKEKAARELGAHEYIDATKGDAGEALWALGGAQLALTTALSNDAFTPLIKGLGITGKLLIITGVPGDITVDATAMIMRGISVQAWPVANALDNEKTIAFAHLHQVDCAIETFPLSRAQDAFDAMMNGTVRFRAVITMN
ncbi:dehydrogenase [Pseudomassariella vexata]|uniref:Dehydrogenase n=1 Tax=Pseudomassariella vexata TaxID=1141098 RepID=A0A1Y2EDF2_9PEZI|nr:dehydrogenase [Pseudomassariella vexata]ORY69601.1 dehydrogenase [Pseudomassariella vexata]